MELALEAVKSTNLVYYDKYQYEEVTVEGCTIQDLPLVPANRTKKSYKEFFQHVPNVSEQELQSIQAAFVDGTLNLPGLPDCVRPRDALGEACRLQLIIEQKTNGEWQALKFFHSTADFSAESSHCPAAMV